MDKLLAQDKDVTGELATLGLRKESSQELIEEIEKVSKVAQQSLLRPESDMAVVVALFVLYRYDKSLLRSAFHRLDMAFAQAPWPRRFLKYLIYDLPVSHDSTLLSYNMPDAPYRRNEWSSVTQEHDALTTPPENNQASPFTTNAELVTETEIVGSPSREAENSQAIITQTMEEPE